MTTITTGRPDAEAVVVRTVSLGWALKRAAMAMLIFGLSVTGAALLMHAAIEPEPTIEIVPVSARDVFRDFSPSL